MIREIIVRSFKVFTILFLPLSTIFLVLLQYAYVDWFISQQVTWGVLLVTLMGTAMPFIGVISFVALFEKEKNVTLRVLLSFLLSFFYILNGLLVSYYVSRQFPLDFYFFWYNRGDVISVLDAIFGQVEFLLLGLVVVLLWGSIGVFLTIEAVDKKLEHLVQKKLWAMLFVLSIVFVIWAPSHFQSEAVNFLNSAVREESTVSKLYTNKYQRLQEKNKEINVDNLGKSSFSQDNIFIVQLESLNSFLVDQEITPNLFSVAQSHGVLFPQVQSASVHTIRGQETLLCGLLPSLGVNIANNLEDVSQLTCLPKILKEKGYKTIFITRGNTLEAGNVGRFMQAIGFDEIHGGDITQPGDPFYAWGYDEEVYIKRIFEYLETLDKKQKLFVFISLGTANHFPFYDESKPEYARYKDIVPIKQPESIRETLINSTFIQDIYLGQFWDKFIREGYLNNSHLLITSDHSWPIGLHPYNVFNEHEAWQENLVSPAVYIPSQRSDTSVSTNATDKHLFSQIDISATILDIAKVREKIYPGDSMLRVSQDLSQCVISVQPYGEGQVVAIYYPQKYIFKIRKNQVVEYDLEKDPYEQRPISRDVSNSDIEYLGSCLENV